MSQFLIAESATLAAMAGLMVLSGLFSGSETALFCLGRDELDSLARRRPRAAGAARRLLATPERLLVSVLFGNLVVNVLYFSLGAGVSFRALRDGGRAAGAGAGLGTLLLLILFGEILPKAVAAGSPSAAATLKAIPLWLFHQVVGRPAHALASPALRVVDRLARSKSAARARAIAPEELRMLVDLAGRSGAITGHEAEMLDGAVVLSEVRVREVMVPRVDVAFASVAERPEQVLARLRAGGRTRAPVYDGPVDNIVGVVGARDLLSACLRGERRECGVGDLARPVEFVPESAPLSSLLRRVRDEGLEFAVVVDEYGGTAGLFTLEDLAETILGDVGLVPSGGAPAPGEAPAEDQAPAVETTASGAYVLAGDLSVREWAELFDVEPERGQFDTLGGFVTYLLNRIPRRGDVVRWGNLLFTVREMRGRRVARVELSLMENGSATEEAEDIERSES